VSNGTGDGVRWIEVSPDRVVTWLESFAQRHGDVVIEPEPAVITFRAEDGAVAECHVPFPPLPRDAAHPALPRDAAHPAQPRDAAHPAQPRDAAHPAQPRDAAGTLVGIAEQMAVHARAPRTVGVLLVRLGGYAAGVFTGREARLAASKVGSRLVHGRSAAGGQSQQRFARRREKQASEALDAAAHTAAIVFAPYAGKLDAVVLGGDRRAVAGLRDDPRLRPYLELAVDRFLTVPDPRLAVLRGAPRQFRAIRIRLTG
jgi:Actinobacteria/chloroflexi VLRF1 release factor